VPISVVVAEDDFLVRRGLVTLVEASAELRLLEVCDGYDALLGAIESHDPDVVLTDIRMPPTHTDEGLRIADWLRDHRPRTGVVVLSQYSEPEYAVALLEKGASGRAYLLKERVGDAEQLVHAVREVAAGGSVIDARVVDALMASRSRAPSVLSQLTPREREVLEALARGLNNAGIAAELSLTEHAIERHINSIFSKLGLSEEVDVHRRVKAALLFLADGAR
jgi:DNA-binding NarL/FixJ family response regulator